MKLELHIAPLDLDKTLGCGQTFRWKRLQDGSWTGPLSDQLVALCQKDDMVQVDAFPGRADLDRLVAGHLRECDDIPRIQRALGRDARLARGIAELEGLRIVKMDEWECLMSFTLATYANIPRISAMIEALARAYGERIAEGVYTFPTQRRLRKATARELARCGLGYRANYARELCREVDEGALERLKKLKYRQLREELKELPGVGDKVADCVSLFGFGMLESFPIDLWIERALARLYRAKGSYRKLREFASRRFGPYAGYAQEYLYYNERLRAKNGACLFLKQ
ncbi:MAG: DNA-3-methyladenine glycosylase family protein [Thermoplasmata archaeon]